MATTQQRLITSGSLSRLETRLLQEVRQEKARDQFRPVVVLCSSGLVGHFLSRELVRHGTPHLGISFLSFNELALAISRRHLLERQLVPVPEGGRGLIVRKIIRNLGDNSYFSTVKDQPHLPDVLAASFTDLEDSLFGERHCGSSNKWKTLASAGKIAEVLALHKRYREHLLPHMYAEADLLTQAASRALTFAPTFGTDRLFVYGFYELTHAQREFLQGLLQYVNLTAFLFWEEGARFRASDDLRLWWQGVAATHENLDREESATDLIAARRNVFTDVTEAREEDGSFRVISCPNEVSEVREIAREAVRLRREQGISFSEMAVLARDSDGYLPLLASTFQQLGVPFYVREGLSLIRTAAGMSILALMRLPEGNFKRFEVMEWLTLGAADASTLTTEGPHAPVTLWDRLSIEAGIVEGEQEWREKLESLAAGYEAKLKSAEESRKSRMRFRANQVRLLLTFIEGLSAAAAEWKSLCSWSALAEAAISALRKFHPRTPEREQVQDALRSLRDLDNFHEPVELFEFVRVAEQTLSSKSQTAGSFQETGIHLLSLMQARQARFRVVFLCGLTERSFPIAGREDPILLDEERKSLSPELPLKSVRANEEKLLFMLALESAQEKLILTFPRAEAVSGTERVASYYVLRALESVAGHSIAYADLNKSGATPPRLRYIRNSRPLSLDKHEAIDEREYDLGCIRSCLESDAPETGRFLEHISPNFARAVHAEQIQWGTASLTCYDGLLASDECRVILRKLFDENRVYSATSLERYASCPYHFFLEHVLHLEKLEDPTSIEELAAKDKGDLIHRILRDFYEQMKREHKVPLLRDQLPYYRGFLLRVCNEHFRETEREGLTGFESSWELKQKFIIQDLERHLLAELDRDESWLPQEFECAFGMDGAPNFEISTPHGPIRLRGKIDRIDLSDDGNAIRVIDYKTGRCYYKREVKLGGGTTLQLPIYLLATLALFPKIQVEESRAEYCFVSRAGGWKPCVFKGKALEEGHEDLTAVLSTIVQGCRDGIFPRCQGKPSVVDCSKCDFHTVGDPRREILWTKKRDDPRLAPIHEMRSKE